MTVTSCLAPESLGSTICVGEILVEIMAIDPGKGFLEPLNLVGPFPSGAPAIFIDQCARLGGSAGLIGTVGNDDFGKLVIARLKRDGAETSAISVADAYPTGTAFVRYRPDGTRDFVFNIARSAASRMAWNDAIEASVRRAGHLHVMGTALTMPSASEIIQRAAAIVKSRGGTLSLDPNLRKELAADRDVEVSFATLVDMADLLLPSGAELLRAGDAASPEGALEALFRRGAGEVVLKKGADGASYFGRDGSHIDSAAFDVAETDPTGAGDCFGAAYVTCSRLGMPVERALDYANAAGARNVMRRGPMEGAGTRAELDEFIDVARRRLP
jgi:sugar/nucleoside kinase (ribokinase family)